MKPNDGDTFQCPCCKDCHKGFQKVMDLKNAGLVIYRHNTKDMFNDAGIIEFAMEAAQDVFIIHNTKNIDITSADYLPEIENKTVTCPRCRKIIEHAQKLLHKVPTINKYDVKGICDHCRTKDGPCFECEDIVKKFISNKTKRTEMTKQKVKQWLTKIKYLLKDAAVDNEIGRDRVRAHSELYISQLCHKVPESGREPEVKEMFFPASSDFHGAFPPSVQKRNKMFAHFPQLEKFERPVFIIEPPETSGKPSTSRLEDRDYVNNIEVDSGNLRSMFRPSLIEEKNKKKVLKVDFGAYSPLAPFKSVDSFISGKDESVTHEKKIGPTLRKMHYDEELEINKTHLFQRGNVLGSNVPQRYDTYDDRKTKITSIKVAGNRKHVVSKPTQRAELEKKHSFDSSQTIKGLIEKTSDSLDYIRNIQSEEALLTEDTGGVFNYVFPKSVSAKLLKRQISSSELIKDTQDVLLAKAKAEKKRLEEIEKKKLEEEERKRISREEKRIELEAKKKAKEEAKRLELEKLAHKKEVGVKKEEKVTVKKDGKETVRWDGKDNAGRDEKDAAKRDEKDATKRGEKHIAKRDEKDSVNRDKEGTAKRDEKDAAKRDEKNAAKRYEKDAVKRDDKGKEQLQKVIQRKPEVKTKSDTGKNDIAQKSEREKHKLDTVESTSTATTKNIAIESQKESKGPKELKVPSEIKKNNELKKVSEPNDPKELKALKEIKEPNVDKSFLKANKGDEKTEKEPDKKDGRNKIEKEEKDNLKKDTADQLRKEKEIKDLENKLMQKNKDDLAREKIKENQLKKEKNEAAAKLKELEAKAKKLEGDKIPKTEPEKKSKEKKGDEKTAKEKKEDTSRHSEDLAHERIATLGTLKPMINIAAVTVRRASPDDLILQLVRIKQSTGTRERNKPTEESNTKLDNEVKRHKVFRKKRKTALITCNTCQESIIELDSKHLDTLKNKDKKKEAIFGQKIFKCKLPMEERQGVLNVPLLFQTTFDPVKNPPEEVQAVDTAPTEQKLSVIIPTGKKFQAEQETPKGIVRYALSDRTFIDKGWTMLPTEKVVRKMNVYRMRPAHPEFDWFKHNMNKKLMQYDTGEKLAEFDDNGRGRWFYRNGRMALDYYDAEELNAGQRFVIYSSGDPDERGRAQPYTLIATFDYLGNGIVFDHNGKIRLKYNQTEGVVLDRSIGPVSHWKWHTLNDPPVLQQVMIDTHMAHKDPSILKLGGDGDDIARPDNEDMLAIEFDNFIKEKSKKLSQSFKPFQIKMKALKINEHFSLRVLDQATVYLIYRDGTTNLKLNIGMVLDHKEIVDTETAEVGEVSINIEKLPARTDSLAGLQKSIAHAQRYERLRTERELRLRPTIPEGSADRLVSAVSRPLRPPLRAAPSGSTISSSRFSKCTRKLAANNTYYDTRLY